MTLGHDRRILLLALLAGLPSLAAAAVLLWLVPASDLLRGTVLGALLVGWLVAARAAQLRVVHPLQVIANLLAGLREGHFTLRAREDESDDVLGAVRREVNALQETLRDQRLGALEADALLRRVMEEIDVAVFAFDAGGALPLANPARRRPGQAPPARQGALRCRRVGPPVRPPREPAPDSPRRGAPGDAPRRRRSARPAPHQPGQERGGGGAADRRRGGGRAD